MALFNREDPLTFPEAMNSLSFGKDAPSGNNWGLYQKEGVLYLAQGEHCIFPVDSLLIKGVHNWLNALAACALAQAAGVSQESMISVLRSFKGLAHRCQWVRTLEDVEWVNDSKGTNIGAAISAIEGIGQAIKGKIVLIAGGQGKGADFSELSAAITQFVHTLILIGEDAPKMAGL